MGVRTDGYAGHGLSPMRGLQRRGRGQCRASGRGTAFVWEPSRTARPQAEERNDYGSTPTAD